MVSVSNKGEERVEQIVVGGAIALALIVGLGLVGQKAGVLDGMFGPPTIATIAAPLFEVITAQAGGSVERALITGDVVDVSTSEAIERDLAKVLPGTEISNKLRVHGTAKDTKIEIVRVSLAADALNEVWPRPRFGDVKRLEMLWKENKVTVRGAVYSAAARAAFEGAFAKLPAEQRGAMQLRDVVRPTVAVAELQDRLSIAVAGRVFTFLADGTLNPIDPGNAELTSSLAPLLKDLRGLEILVSAGNIDRATAQTQSESVRGALVAAGADGPGLRPVPAPANNVLAFIVREKE